MKKISLLLIVLIMPLTLFAHGEADFAKAEDLIETKISCDEITDEQLELIGDYYMEQMHPGEAHELMDERIGGEGSEDLKQMHINMAKSFYCGEHDIMNPGMMNMMMGGSRTMMGNYFGYGMSGMGFFGWIIPLLIIVALILLILWLIKQIQKK